MKVKAFIFACGFLAISACAQEKLVFAVDVIRHGDRTPIDDIANPPYHWSDGLGALTSLGMQQEYQLGAKKRKFYVTEYHLLAPQYQAPSMYVYSTDVDRTLMSAESFLLGLYPLGTGPKLHDGAPALPLRFQPIPIHIATWTFAKNERVPLLEKYVYQQKDWQDKEKMLSPHFMHWSQVTGDNIQTLYQLITLGDALYARQQHGVPLPPGLSVDDVNMIIAAGSWAGAKLYQPHAVAHAAVHDLLMQIDEYLLMANDQSQLKYVLYSAHDATILALLSDLYVPLNQQVPYVADINILLFENSQHAYSVKVTYNDQPINIPACGGSVCSLAKFIAIDR